MLRGLLFAVSIAVISYFITLIPFMAHTGISSLVIAIIIGITVGNGWHHPTSWNPGVQFAAKRILRLAIVLYGFRISFQQIASVGMEAFFLDVIVVISTLFVGYFIGRKLFRLDRDLSILISAGAAICGAAAVLAVEDVLKSEPYKTSIAIGTVVLFGTISMFLYPAMQHAGYFGFADFQFGVFAGASVHEVAQAMVAGNNISPETGDVAVIVKMIRVLLLMPVLIVLSLIMMKTSISKKIKFSVPWFAVGFLLVIAFNSLHLLPTQVVTNINQLDILLLTTAMGAIGLETKFAKIKHVGMKPLYLSAFLFVWLMTSVALMVSTT